MTENEYRPDVVLSPGETLKEYISNGSISLEELVKQTGYSEKVLNEILEGLKPLTSSMADRLSEATGRPAHFWNNLEKNYREALVRMLLTEEDRPMTWMEVYKELMNRGHVGITQDWVSSEMVRLSNLGQIALGRGMKWELKK